MTPILRAPLRCNRALTLSALVAVLTAPLLPMPSASAVEPAAGLQVDASNDADGDGVFTDAEEVGGAGRAVTFQATVTNGSGLPVTIVSLTNTMLETGIDLLDEAHCPEFDGLTLAPDEAQTCTFTLDAYLRTYGPTPREQLTNVVHLTATDGERALTAEDDSTVTNPNAGKVSVEVDKTNDADGDGTFTDDEQATGAGTDVTFQVAVHNTSPGSVVITGLTDTWPGLDEPIDLFASCPELEGKKLWGGGHDDEGGHDDGHDGGHERPTSATCTFTLQGYAPAPGDSLTDTVTVTVAKRHSPDRSATASDTSTVWTPDPGIGLEKRIAPAQTGPFGDHDDAPGLAVSIPPDGTSVWYELEVTNTGDVPLTQITLDDAQADNASCTIPTALVPGASFDCVVGPVDAEAGDHANEATATATGADQLVQATDAAHYRGTVAAPTAVERPAITLTNSAEITPDADGVKYVRYDPRDSDEETVTYLFTIENTGETPLSDVTLSDELLGGIELASTTLQVGETWRIEATHVVDDVDAATETMRNTATVHGTSPDGTTVTAEATEEVVVLEAGTEVRAEAVPAPPAVLPRAGASVLGLGILAMAALSGGLSLVLVGRNGRRRHA